MLDPAINTPFPADILDETGIPESCFLPESMLKVGRQNSSLPVIAQEPEHGHRIASARHGGQDGLSRVPPPLPCSGQPETVLDRPANVTRQFRIMIFSFQGSSSILGG
jgi:hypothetical protein